METKVLNQYRENEKFSFRNEGKTVKNTSEIQNFFKDQNVFITGGTGFLGKLLIEKLLRVCNDVKKIYLLVRTKKGKSEAERFAEIFDAECFEILKKKQPNFLEKVVLINGDCSKPDVGLDETTKSILLNEIDTIFHVAATVRFDQHLKSAAYINVRAVRDLLRMAKKMSNLKAFVHVSTAYSHCPKSKIMEEFYRPPITGENLLRLVESLDDETITKITPQILKDWPNGYVFTKAVAESVVEEEGRGLPVAMIRPAIVTISAKEPFPGWIDNIYGVNGVVAGAGLGILRTMPAEPDFKAELVPVDLVINNIIASAWDISKKEEENNSPIPIYNFVMSPYEILTWGKFFKMCYEYGQDFPTSRAIWHFCFALRPNPISHEIALFFLHTIPAYFMDFLLICMGRKPMAVEGYKKARKFLDVIAYFAKRNWEFGVGNVDKLSKKMNECDKKLFDFDLRHQNLNEILQNGIIGGRKYLLKDPLSTLPEARKKKFKLMIAHYVLCAFLLYALFKFVLLLINLIF